MAIRISTFVIIICFFYQCATTVTSNSASFNRTVFPADFIFGAGSSAYQYEGAANIDGKAPSIWDIFTRQHPEKIKDHSAGDVAEDFYHLYKRDIALMKMIGLDSFRFSISWSRLLPRGKISGGVNALGVKFYNDLIDELLSNGLKPFVTILHFDVPQSLTDEFGGVLSPNIVEHYKDYANFCFKTFGDRVKHWVTLNEPYMFSKNGYATGEWAPGRCSNYVGNCTNGNSATEPYIVGHHLLLSHAEVVKLYREKYQVSQKGEIGITLNSHWFVPKYNTESSRNAASRALDFMLGWFAHPITYGDYPKIMRELVGKRLPKFTEAQSKMLKGSLDFLGINYYTAYYAENAPSTKNVYLSSTTDSRVTSTNEKNGIPIGQQTALSNWCVYPKGIGELVLHVKDHYQNPVIYITENGFVDSRKNASLVKDALNDSLRISYHRSHLKHLAKSIQEGAEVKGYYMWSFLDDFELDLGYAYNFGLVYVDFANGLKRYLRNSAYWMNTFLLK